MFNHCKYSRTQLKMYVIHVDLDFLRRTDFFSRYKGHPKTNHVNFKPKPVPGHKPYEKLDTKSGWVIDCRRNVTWMWRTACSVISRLTVIWLLCLVCYTTNIMVSLHLHRIITWSFGYACRHCRNLWGSRLHSWLAAVVCIAKIKYGYLSNIVCPIVQ